MTYTEHTPPSQRTFVIGGTFAQARAWCQANGVQPFAHATFIVVTANSARGLTIRPEDRVVWFDAPIDPRLVESVRLAQIVGGLR